MAQTDNNPQTPAQNSMSIDDLLASASTLLAQAGGGGTKNFLGLPSTGTSSNLVDYTVDAAADQKIPRYQEGSQLAPLMENWDPVKTWGLQQQLVSAGLLDNDFIKGWWDKPSQDAFAEVLGAANASGTDWPTALTQVMNAQPVEIDPKTGQVRRRIPGQAKRAPLVTKFTNPDDLAAVANDVAQKRLGRTFTQDELNQFVRSYHGTEASAQQTAYDASAGGGSATEAPQADTAANLFAEKIDPVASTARNMLPLVDGINKIMKGYLGGTTQPLTGGT